MFPFNNQSFFGGNPNPFTSPGGYPQQSPATISVGYMGASGEMSAGDMGQEAHTSDMFGAMGSLFNDFKNMAVATHESINSLDGKTLATYLKYLLQTGNVLQMTAKSTGKNLQIVTSAIGSPTIDGYGPKERFHEAVGFNAKWTVISEGDNQIRLHNNYNYLSITNGYAGIVYMPPGTVHGPDTLFEVALNGLFMTFASASNPECFFGVAPTGEARAVRDGGMGDMSQFSVREERQRDFGSMGGTRNRIAEGSLNSTTSIFQTGNVVRLTSKKGGDLCVYTGHHGHGLHGHGGYGADTPANAQWTVIKDLNERIRLHNNYNYISINMGRADLINMAPNSEHGLQTQFKMSFSGAFVTFESAHNKGCYLGIDFHGGPQATRLKTTDCMKFTAMLESSPYPHPPL